MRKLKPQGGAISFPGGLKSLSLKVLCLGEDVGQEEASPAAGGSVDGHEHPGKNLARAQRAEPHTPRDALSKDLPMCRRRST